MNEILKGQQADLLNVILGKSSGEWYHPVAPLDIIVLSSSAWDLLRSICPNRWDKRHGKGFDFIYYPSEQNTPLGCRRPRFVFVSSLRRPESISFTSQNSH